MGPDFTNPNWTRRQEFAALFQGKAHLYPQCASALEYARKSGADTVALGLQQQAQPSTSQAVLRRVKQTVLVIAGEKDPDNGRANELAKLIPQSKFVTVPGGTHNDTMSKPEFGQEVLRFLLK